MRVLIVAAVVLLAGEAAAQSCQAYKGKVVNAVAFEEAVESYRQFDPKGEFETTAEYEKRQKETLKEAASATLIIRREPDSRSSFPYDADRNRLTITRQPFVSFDGYLFDFWTAFQVAGMWGKIKFGMIEDNIGVIVSRVDRRAGAYEGSTGLGVPVQVKHIERRTAAIFDRKKGGYTWELFPVTEGKYDSVVGYLTMKPDEARALKPELRLAYVVRPKSPYYVRGKHRVAPKLSTPYDIVEDFEILIADIRCGLVMDGAGKVLGAWETR